MVRKCPTIRFLARAFVIPSTKGRYYKSKNKLQRSHKDKINEIGGKQC